MGLVLIVQIFDIVLVQFFCLLLLLLLFFNLTPYLYVIDFVRFWFVAFRVQLMLSDK